LTRDEKPEYYGHCHCHIAELSSFGLCTCQLCWPSGTEWSRRLAGPLGARLQCPHMADMDEAKRTISRGREIGLDRSRNRSG